MEEEMEMPTPCIKCNDWFELNEGRPSKEDNKITICPNCADKESV